jgi:4-methyl-5(b-hydroxyethyl)-thiazole monophosphate biosynthesis
MSIRALILLHPDFEEIEAVTPIDLLSRAEIEVVQAAFDEHLMVRGRSGIMLKAQHCLTDITDEPFDAIILPGGPGIMQIRKHPLLCELLQKQHAANRLIGCICAAPLLLLDAGLCKELRYTCHPTTQNELCDALEASVVQDNHIITSRGAGTATEFALHLVSQLTDQTVADRIAESICLPD